VATPIRKEDGKFDGSIGDGKTKIPTVAAPVPSVTPADPGSDGQTAWKQIYEKFMNRTADTSAPTKSRSTSRKRAELEEVLSEEDIALELEETEGQAQRSKRADKAIKRQTVTRALSMIDDWSNGSTQDIEALKAQIQSLAD
jgi:hypothetical protein